MAGEPVSKGEPVWGLKTEKCGVLYISLEDTFQRMQQLVNFLTAHPRVKLAIIDTLQRVRKAEQEQY